MIDLHIHTVHSDGKDTVKEILEKAQEIGLTTLSITDHDSVDAYEELKKLDYTKYYRGKIITGCEFSVSFMGVRIEFLGYGIDVKKIKSWLDNQYNDEKFKKQCEREFADICNSCNEKGIILSKDFKYDNTVLPVDCIYYEIIKHNDNKEFFKKEEWDDISLFWRKCSTDPTFPIYFDYSKITVSAKEVSKLIREAGGKVFLAHLYRYQKENKEEILEALTKQKLIDGIEVYYPTFTEEQTKILENYCKRNNLLMCGGTDYHNKINDNRKLGIGFGNLNISENILDYWGINK
ncbi:MAG: PHP domain-containing protein [Clostridia bacterium]|nr:PHP domain-containing protein [Clostridia bacterium]MDD4375849.1 PHP domain-containing protein [Clostridia bacterium]